jgi:hypothetical protein
MRSALTVLLAFAAGVLLMVWWPGHRAPRLAAVRPAPAAMAAAASINDAPDAAVADDVTDGGYDWPDQAPTPEQVLYAQPRMMRDALAELTPRVAGKPNLYALVFAGDGGEGVFRNEAEYAGPLFARRFGASTHTLVLENSPAALTTRPLATWSNLEAALAGLAKVMRPEQDILLLYFTSHGSEDHTLLVDMNPLPLDQIGADDLAGILAAHRFKWKIVVVNACYSGGFVPPLRSQGTLVLTAARADRSSFGCGSDSDITYFGRAWLVDALNRTPDFIDAFRLARGEISQWERQDRLTPSEPQIDIGTGIAEQLALWRKGFTPGPKLAFKSATREAPGTTAGTH